MVTAATTTRSMGAHSKINERRCGASKSVRAVVTRKTNGRARTSTRAVTEAVNAEIVRDKDPGVLYDSAYIGESSRFDAILDEKSAVLRAYAQAVEDGDYSLSADATAAAEWVRQALVERIENKGKLQPAQSKVLLGDCVDNLVTLAENNNCEALWALQAVCYRNSSACWKIGSQSNMFAYFRQCLTDGAPEPVQNAAMFLASTLVAFNEDLHRVTAKSRLIPTISLLLQNKCGDGGCLVDDSKLSWKDVRGLTVCEHALSLVRNLSLNGAQTKLLTSNGMVEICAAFLPYEGFGRVQSAMTIANLVGREDNNNTLGDDETVMESVVALLEKALEGERYMQMNCTVWKIVQGIANMATMEAAKPRLAKAGVIKLLVRVLREKQHQWDRASFWAAGALWNLAFDEVVREQILQEPGLIEALEEARRLGSENTKMKARGALWMIQPPAEDNAKSGESGATAAAGLSQEDMQKLGAIENAKAQVMLSYEWHHQAQVVQLKEELNARGFNVWMDVDRMMGSTLEAMAAAIESSDAIIMCVSRRYKESQACRTEAEYAYTRKKCLIPVMFEKGYKPDGWLGILVGSKLYYNMFNTDMMHQSLPGLTNAVEAVQNDSKAPKFLQKGGGESGSESASDSSQSAMASTQTSTSRSSSEDGVSVPKDSDDMERWLSAVGLQAYVHVFDHHDIYGKVLLKMHQELGQLKIAEQHELLQNVLGMQSYGHRLLFLTEVEELVGTLDGRLRKAKDTTAPPARPEAPKRNGIQRGAPKKEKTVGFRA